MSKDTCVWIPKVTLPNNRGEEPSRMFTDMISKKGLHYSRELALTIYANYVSSDIEKQMEEAKDANDKPLYTKNRQGQFNAKDVIDFLGIEKRLEEVNNLQDEELRLGAVEYKGGSRVDFTDAEEVLNKVNDFNNSHKGLVAAVDEHTSSEGEPIYNILVYESSPSTMDFPVRTRERLKAWEIYKQFFSHDGIDITDAPKELKSVFNANNITLVSQIRNLTLLENKNMYKKDVMTLLYLNRDIVKVRNLLNTFGSIEDIANVVDDLNHGVNKITPEQKHLITMALNKAKERLRDLDLTTLTKQIDELTGRERDESPEVKLKNEIHRLNKKYNIGINEINDFRDKIRTLSDANKTAITQLNRRIRELRKEKGKTEEGKRLEGLYNKLIGELNIKHYYNGMIDYLMEASNDVASIDKMLETIPQAGDTKENIFKTAKILQSIKRIRDQYIDVVSALASDNVTMDEVVSQTDIDNIKKQAKDLYDIFNKNDKKVNDLTKNLVRDCLRIMSDGKISESEINDTLEKAIKDVSWLDRFLYSVGTSNNILVATAGKIMRNAETNRTSELEKFKTKVSQATNKLYKAGYNTEFMYEDQRHIVSDIDWKMYEKAKSDKDKALRKRGLKDFDLQEAMEEWEDANTEDRVVDKKTGRTERVPGKFYRKTVDFQDGWSQEQKEYYDTIMEYKGEVESLYPSYAQNLYLPPQVRRNFGDAIVGAKNAKDVGKAVWNTIKDPFVIREDDTTYAENGMIGGEETQFVEGDYDNTPKKEIPIFFQKPVEQGELLKDFSSALLHHASSAYNYKAMNEIKDTVETIRDFVDDSKLPATDNPQAELTVDKQTMRMVKPLYKWGKKSNVSNILNGFIDQHIYGMKRNPSENKKWAKFFDTVIAYTSFKGLAFNLPGATANALMGINQILIDATSGEFFGFKDLGWASTKLFGKNGIPGEIMESVTNNVNSKAGLLREMFDPLQENFENVKGTRYYHSIFRHLVSKDLRFIGYESGEHLIHLMPMYAILHKQKVKFNGEEISLYDAFDVKKENGNSELVIKDGVTDLDGNPITQAFIDKIRGRIRYVNQSMHGAMNDEDRGLIHQYMLGRLAMNFKQWMIGHYSRRFRGRHMDDALGDYREGYYTSVWKFFMNNETKDAWNYGHKGEALGLFMKDLVSFAVRSSTQWSNLNEMQRYNLKRARAEICMFLALTGLSFALGDPDKHKGDFWRRWWIYQTKRMITETEASMPFSLGILNSAKTIFQSPMAGINTLNSMLYVLYGLTNGDLYDEVQSGPHKGENRYWRNVVKYDLPFFKDWERLQTLSDDDSLYKVFDYSPSNH